MCATAIEQPVILKINGILQLKNQTSYKLIEQLRPRNQYFMLSIF